MNRWFKYIALAVFLLVLSLVTGTLSIISYQLNRPMIAHTGSSQIFQIDKSSSAASFVQNLNQSDLIKYPRILLDYIRWKKLTSKLKAGIYEIQPGESALTFLNRVIAGDVLKQSFRIIEGTTHYQVDMNLRDAKYLNYNPEDWSFIAGTYASPEGMLLADTYAYDAGSDGKQLLSHAHTQLTNYLNTSWQNRSLNLPYRTAYDLLIVASILEKETGVSEERRTIAGVIVNRLKLHMPLQVDPTVIYAMGPHFKGKLTHLNMQINSPYNTYRNRGLPPTPIAMVGKDAIDAAAHPEEHKYLYFVAKGDGTHQFSSTYEEQKSAIQRYLRNHHD